MGPLVVTVSGMTSRWNASAVARKTRDAAGSLFWLAICPAATSPAISAAMVEGEKPVCSSHRSTPSDGPWATRNSAAGFTWSSYRAWSPPRPDCQAIRIGYAVSSSCSPPVSGAAWPLGSELRGSDPSGRCCRPNRNVVMARALAKSPSVRKPVKVSYASRENVSR